MLHDREPYKCEISRWRPFKGCAAGWQNGRGVLCMCTEGTWRAVRVCGFLAGPKGRVKKATVSVARQQFEACDGKVEGALTDELATYQQGSPVTKVQRWDAEGPALIGPLHCLHWVGLLVVICCSHDGHL